jgi:hypothetical protein
VVNALPDQNAVKLAVKQNKSKHAKRKRKVKKQK